jgi:hypothetical protein
MSYRISIPMFAGLIWVTLITVPAGAASDPNVLADYNRQRVALERKIVSAPTTEEALQLFDEEAELFEVTLSKLTGPTRQAMLVSRKVNERFERLMWNYLRMANSEQLQFVFDLPSISGSEDLQQRIAVVKNLIDANEELLIEADALQTNGAAIIEKTTLGKLQRAQLLEAHARQLARVIGPAKAIRNLGTKTYKCWHLVLMHLHAKHGKWSFTPERKLIWQNEDDEAVFIGYLQEFLTLQQKLEIAQKAYSERLD